MGRKYAAAVFHTRRALAVAGAWGPFVQVDAQMIEFARFFRDTATEAGCEVA